MQIMKPLIIISSASLLFLLCYSR